MANGVINRIVRTSQRRRTYLRLNGIKMREIVEHFVFVVVERAERKRLQIEEFRVRRMALRQEKMLEAQRQNALW